MGSEMCIRDRQSTSPATPTGLGSTARLTDRITLTWSQPLVSSGSPVTGFKVYQREVHEVSQITDLFESGGVEEDVVDHFLSPSEEAMVVDTLLPASRAVINTTQRLAVISGLTGGANETYVVSAVSNAGEGNRSEPLSVSSCPPAVGGLSSLSQTTSAIVLTWAAPTITTGLPVTSYTVKRNNGTLSADVSVAVVCDGTALATTCNVSGLEGGRVYDLSLIHI